MDPVLAQTQLWRGIATTNPAWVEQALTHGANPNAVYGKQEVYSHIQPLDTPLHALFRTPEKRMQAHTGRLVKAAKGAIAQILGSLLDHGADPTTLDADQCTPLMLFCQRTGNEVPSSGIDRLVAASKSVLEQRQHIQGNTGLHLACERQEKSKVKILLKHGANPEATNAHGNTPLWTTLATISLEQIYAKPNDRNGWGIVDLLQAHGAQINRSNDDQMPWMAYPGLPLERLSAKGADLAWKNAAGRDALLAQLEKMEDSGFFGEFHTNLAHLLNVPGLDWSCRTMAGRTAAEVSELMRNPDIQAMLGQVRARVQSAQLDATTRSSQPAARSARL